MIPISIIRLDPSMPMPAPALPGDAGLDLCAAEPMMLDPGARAAVRTGIALALPVGTAGLILPRSGWALQHGLTVLNSPGLIDSGYRGEIKVILVNHGRESVGILRGERIAQLVVVRVDRVHLVEATELSPSTRGVGGFGSTGA